MTRVLLATLALLAIAACTAPAATPGPGPVVLMTHDSFAVSDEVIASFEGATGNTVEILKGGDAGSMVNQAVLTKDAPLADVLFGVDNTFLSRALDEEIFEPYRPAGADALPADLVLDQEFRVTPVDYGDVCVNYDREAFTGDGDAPQALEDLSNPAFDNQLVVQNPATSSPGLAFMLATIARFGEADDYDWLDYWAELRANRVLVVAGWEEAYYTHFSGGAGEGDKPLVVSYATSPAAEVAFGDPPPDEAPTGVVTDGCYRQIEFAGLLRGAENADRARQLIDFMLTPEFQQDIPLNMFVFPARSGLELPDVFTDHAAVVEQPLLLSPADIAARREGWLQEWTDVVLR
jgi:thiamine transport system substrate-binding protein